MYYFGYLNWERYLVLVFDNWGVGGSGKFLMRYFSREMVRDVYDFVMLEEVGFLKMGEEKRCLYVVGILFGGMIV